MNGIVVPLITLLLITRSDLQDLLILYINNSEFIITDFELIDLDYSPAFPKFLIELNDDLDPLQWMNSLNRPLSSDSNLLTNSDFSSGLNYWGYNSDSVKINIVRIDNINAALVERGNGNGEGWSLVL